MAANRDREYEARAAELALAKQKAQDDTRIRDEELKLRSAQWALEKKRTRRDLRLKQDELGLRRDDLEIRRTEQSRGRWNNQLTIAIIAGCFGLLGPPILKSLDEKYNREAEKVRFERSALLEAVQTGDIKSAANNLKFLIALGVLDDPNGRLAESINANQVPVLPPRAVIPVDATPVVAPPTPYHRPDSSHK